MNMDTFYPYILPEVMGCPEPLARMALISAANEFCNDSLAWNSIETESTYQGASEYEPGKPCQSYVIAFKSVYIGSRKLTAVKSIVGSEFGPPICYTTQERGSILVYPTPNCSEQLVMDVAYGPIPSATTLPDFMGIRLMDVITAGAKARLMLMSGAAWVNPQLSAYYQQVFRDGVIAARVSDEHGRNPSSIRVKPRSFG